MQDPATNVAVAMRRDALAGFGIMHYADDTAHLALLAVAPAYRHQHHGLRLLDWLERSAVMAGLRHVDLEARADNHSALAFYTHAGYAQRDVVRGYYEGVVDAARLRKTLT
jgi:ribosomal-protein-alanine N-acetyltransferase